ncbi:CDP-diacylglycerol--serine O-phosphatidyltransferase [Sphingobacteriales bacterium UPWRP_1]|nr:hypothetical protein BVG80_09345 [Sphingobacteriales bacterium TSM_CSM]PSJ78557.1 CDP-diacylglycerol--serine O-phosphatidyltransferase [Sphingobacteriales bacterium UPWRP_1]
MNIKQHIPNIVTLVNLALGCTSIVLAFEGHLFWVPYFIIAAAFADFSDGLLARVLRVSSPLGLQLDSLADMVTFGVVPGVIIFHLLKQSLGVNALWWQFLPALMLTLFSALRLAKFNIDKRQTEGFIGLPTPTCTMFFVALVLIVKNNQAGLAGFILNPMFLSITAVVFSLLLVAELPMVAFKVKNFAWKGNELRYILMVSGVLLLVFLGGLGIALSILLYIAVAFVQRLASGKNAAPPAAIL